MSSDSPHLNTTLPERLHERLGQNANPEAKNGDQTPSSKSSHPETEILGHRGLHGPLTDPTNANVEYVLRTLIFPILSNWPCSIIFVNGLGGGPFKTWTSNNEGRKVFWPKDLLPQECPRARIFSFGIDPTEISPQLTIDEHSIRLIQGLIEMRQATQTVRPSPFHFLAPEPIEC